MASVTPSASSDVASVAVISGWKYIGCYSDHDGSTADSGRLLNRAYASHSDTTVKSCLYFCANTAANGPFSYAGLGTGYECFCGNSLNLNSYNQPVEQKLCDWLCYGDKTQLCGGKGYIGVYQVSANSTSKASGQITGTAPPGSETQPADSTSQSTANHSRPAVGTIAAATVAGLLALIICLIAALWFLRHRRRKLSAVASISDPNLHQQDANKDKDDEKHPEAGPFEAPQPDAVQLASVEVAELPGRH